MITQYLQKRFVLSPDGAKDLKRGILYTTLLNIGLMLPVCYLLFFVMEQIESQPGQEPHGLLFYILLALILMVILYLISLVQYDSTYNAIYFESAKRRITLAEKLRRLPLAFFGERNLSDLTSTVMEDCNQLEQVFSHTMPQLYASILSMLIISVGMIAYDWRMSLALLWVVPLALVIIVLSRSRMKSSFDSHYTKKREVTEMIQEGLESVREIKSYSGEENYNARFGRLLKEYERELTATELVAGTFVNLATVLLKLGMPSVLLVGAWLLMQGELSLFNYFVFLLASAMFYNPILDVCANMAILSFLDIRIERMREIEAMPSQTGETDIADNIRIGKRDATDEEVRRVAELARCDDFISRMPDGYDTIIGENGETLSGGERQRLSIARALLKDAPIILLDEATASLDVENETKIQSGISELVRDKTVLVIAHRMRTVRSVDHIVVLKGGTISEEGTPDELIRRGGDFARMVQLQQTL